MSYLFVDVETFHDSKQKFDLRNMSTIEYIRDSRFKIQGFAYAIDNGPVNWVSACNAEDFLRAAKEQWKDASIVCHNTKFDGLVLAERWINPKRWIDTKGMSRAVLGKSIKGHSLRELAEHFGLESKGLLKTDGLAELNEADEAQLAEYCKHDVELCRQIFEKLKPSFPESQYPVMDWTIRTFVSPKLQLNVKLLEEASKDEKERRENIFSSVGRPKEVFASNQKFAQLLRDHNYDVPEKKSPRTGKIIPALALGDPDFLEMAENPSNRTLFDFCQARIAAKSTLLETRSAKLARIGKTGPWPFDVEFSGATQTHRFSGGSGAGGNPQNFTRGSVLREAVEAPEGYKLVIGDFSNIELRLVAYLSKDPGLIQAFEQDKDLYCDFASAFYGRIITKENETERRFGKTAILGLGYGMGPSKFVKTVRIQTGQVISQEDAERAVALYRAKYNRVPALWEWLGERICTMRKGVQSDFEGGHRDGLFNFIEEGLLLPSGLKIQFPNLRQQGREWVYDVWKKKTEKESVKLYGGKILENISQALAGELTKQALLEVKEWAVGQTHDELMLCVPEGLAYVAAARLKSAMTKSPLWLPDMRLKAEVGIGRNWNEAKK